MAPKQGSDTRFLWNLKVYPKLRTSESFDPFSQAPNQRTYRAALGESSTELREQGFVESRIKQGLWAYLASASPNSSQPPATWLKRGNSELGARARDTKTISTIIRVRFNQRRVQVRPE